MTLIRKKETLFRVNDIVLNRESVTLDNGFETDTVLIHHPGAAAIVPFLDDNTIVLIRQYRHAVAKYLWEIPAGTMSSREDPASCARRELTEETGYEARDWQRVGVVIPAPGMSDEHIYIYKAAGLVRSEQCLERDEIIEVHTVPFSRAMAMIREETIIDSKSVCALLLINDRKTSVFT